VRPKKIIFFSAFLAVLFGCGTYFSYRNARTVADEIVQPVEAELYHYDSSFSLIGLDGQVNPSWRISYEPKEHMVIAPLSVQVSLLGKNVATEPQNLRQLIINRSKRSPPDIHNTKR
jgi:hypothetical protein